MQLLNELTPLLLIVREALLEPFPSGRTILVGHTRYFMKSLVNLLLVCGSDRNASFVKDGKTMSFYPHFIAQLPRHSDEGVWRIDSAALVSVDMNPDDY